MARSTPENDRHPQTGVLVTRDPTIGSSTGSRILLPSTRIILPPVADRQNAISLVSSLYDRLEAQDTIVESYHSMENALQEQEFRGNQLETELNSYHELVPRLCTFVLRRDEELRQQLDAALHMAEGLDEELNQLTDQSQEIADLKNALF